VGGYPQGNGGIQERRQRRAPVLRKLREMQEVRKGQKELRLYGPGENMLTELNNYDWEAAFGEGPADIGRMKVIRRYTIDYSGAAKGKLKSIRRDDVSKIFHMQDGENDEKDWIGIFELKDGRFISVESFCDYTGWDCQAGGTVTVSYNLNDLIRYGVSEKARQRFGIMLSGGDEKCF